MGTGDVAETGATLTFDVTRAVRGIRHEVGPNDWSWVHNVSRGLSSGRRHSRQGGWTVILSYKLTCPFCPMIRCSAPLTPPWPLRWTQERCSERCNSRWRLQRVWWRSRRAGGRQDANSRPSSNQVLSSSKRPSVAMAIVDWRKSDGRTYDRQIGI